MGIVITFWIIMLGIMAVELGAILYYIKHGERSSAHGAYASEVKENTRIVMDAVKSRVIKKHLLTNSAEKYDSGKTLEQYKKFLNSALMSDIMHMCEERYNG